MTRHPPILAVSGIADAVVHHIAPFGLAAAAGTTLVVDLDPRPPTYAGRTLADLLTDGVRRGDLAPTRPGVAVLGNGGVDPEDALVLVERLAERWPALVLRVGDPFDAVPVVPVLPLLPGPLAPAGDRPAVYQSLAPRTPPPGRGVLLPPLGRGRIRSLLAGVVDPRWRWVRAWEKVWRLPWR